MIDLKGDKKKKFFLMLAYVILTSVLVYFLKPVYLLSICIVLLPPSIVNFIWLKKSKRKVMIFSLSATFLFAFAVELVSRLKDAWDVQSVIPRLFGLLPFENILFAFINFFWVLSFYEYFVDKDSSGKISKKFKYLVGLFVLFSFAVFSLYFYDESLIGMNYALVGIVVLLIPSLLIFSRNHKLLKKTVLPIIFFSIVFFVYEVVSILIGSWWWPGEYLLSVNLLGHVFPIDDVVIWYVLSTASLIGGYEFFADDFK